MRYFGGKERVARDLSTFINDTYLKGNDTPFYDLFCGSCNVLARIDDSRLRYGNDKHKYLIAMWKELQNGWLPPKECTEEQYTLVREHLDKKPYVSGFIGFGCSFSGKWFGGYARGGNRNYCLNAYNSTIKKFEKLKDVVFMCKDYFEVPVQVGAVIYCDIPYKNTTAYCKKEVGEFNHDDFYRWCIKNKDSFTILVSEYKHNIPDGFEVVWEKTSKKDIRNKDGEQEVTVEILMTPCK